MDIPERIWVGGHEIGVRFASTAEIGNRGEFNNYHNLIRLEGEGDTPESNIAECFLHEVMEAIKIKNNLTIEHVDLSVLSEGLFQVIRRNGLDFRVV